MDLILAESEIKSLLVRERYYRDSCQWDKLRESYHPDPSNTSIKISWFTGDIDGFVAGSRAMATNGLSAIHIINPVDISIAGSKGFAVSVGSINARFKREGRDYDLISYCRFLSRLQKVDISGGGMVWKMLTMDVIYIYDSIVPAIPWPSGLVIKESSESKIRSSYRYLSWLLAESGHKVRQDLPGVDNEQSVNDITDWGRQWLNN